MTNKDSAVEGQDPPRPDAPLVDVDESIIGYFKKSADQKDTETR